MEQVNILPSFLKSLFPHFHNKVYKIFNVIVSSQCRKYSCLYSNAVFLCSTGTALGKKHQGHRLKFQSTQTKYE